MKKVLLYMIFSSSILLAGGISLEKIFQDTFSKESHAGQKIITLTKVQVRELQQVSQAKIDSAKVRFYVVSNDSKVEGYGVLVINRVRTKKAAILYLIDKDESIKGIEIVQFLEPSEYKPNNTWKALFTGKNLQDDLKSGHGIPTISGATMTARSISDASRIALAIVKMFK